MNFPAAKRLSHQGFTVVELVIVIIIIGILVSIVLVNLSGWRQTTTENQIKSDLNGVAAAMEDARNKGNGYPSSLPSTFQPSNGVTIVYTSGTTTNYCINASDSATGKIKFYIASSGGAPAPQAGSC